MNAPSPTEANQDHLHLQRAVDLALENVRQGGGPFGAVIVKDGKIIAEGCNQVVPHHDPTAHAEIEAIRAACATLEHFHLEGCTLYASSEPCPMCMAAAYWARVDRIVYANHRQKAAAIGFCDDELYEQLQRPHLEKRIPVVHLPLPNAEAPLRDWHESSDKTVY